MNVLVTGATGFIGNYVVRELLNNNIRVTATSASQEKAAHFSWFGNVRYVPLDISRFDKNENYFAKFHHPDVIIHLAWGGLPNYDALFHIEKTFFNQFLFLKTLISNGATDITVAGTCFEYGLKEGCLSEDFPSNPINCYALAKDTLRKFLEQLQKQNPFSLKWGRLFYMYGKGQNPNSLFAKLENALNAGLSEFDMSGGEQQRDYLPVEKMAEYLVKIALQRKVEGIINCCSGTPVTINTLIEQYLDQMNQKIKLNRGVYSYPAYEPMHFWGNNFKLNKILGLSANT